MSSGGGRGLGLVAVRSRVIEGSARVARFHAGEKFDLIRGEVVSRVFDPFVELFQRFAVRSWQSDPLGVRGVCLALEHVGPGPGTVRAVPVVPVVLVGPRVVSSPVPIGGTVVASVVHAAAGVQAPQLLDKCQEFTCVAEVEVADFLVDEKAEAAAEATDELDVRGVGRLFVDPARVVLGEVVHDVEETVNVFVQRVPGGRAVLMLQGSKFGTEGLRGWDSVSHVDAGVVESSRRGESSLRRLV